mmetsp:Transcript_38645/g.99224  ORF Transcript_38645/g.99224 Transcript_38645/m.99224 type:complete len:142 (+) Transcript_38645:244-669(+)
MWRIFLLSASEVRLIMLRSLTEIVKMLLFWGDFVASTSLEMYLQLALLCLCALSPTMPYSIMVFRHHLKLPLALCVRMEDPALDTTSATARKGGKAIFVNTLCVGLVAKTAVFARALTSANVQKAGKVLVVKHLFVTKWSA